MSTNKKKWRCFHCDEVFTDPHLAHHHFGISAASVPSCLVDAKQLREMEAQLAKYREEDTELHQQIRSLQCEHQSALMRAEEEGYSKGLRDGRQLSDAATWTSVPINFQEGASIQLKVF